LNAAFHDFKKQGVPEAQLDTWLAALDWETLLNRKGTTWRKLDAAVQASVTDSASAKKSHARTCQHHQAAGHRLAFGASHRRVYTRAVACLNREPVNRCSANVPAPVYRSYPPVYSHVTMGWGWPPAHRHGHWR